MTITIPAPLFAIGLILTVLAGYVLLVRFAMRKWIDPLIRRLFPAPNEQEGEGGDA